MHADRQLGAWAITLATLVSAAAEAAPAARLWPLWDQVGSSTALIDHGNWQQFLDRHLQVTDDGRTVIAYAEVGPDGRALLDGYMAQLTALDPRAYPRDVQMAYWINLYNALTVTVVLDHPEKESILRMGRGFFSIGPWDDPVTEVAGETLTLNDIEHRILRPIWQDERIHYAVNCASVGCPNLARRAYTAANLEEMLNAAEQAYLNHPRGLELTADGTLRLSTIFKWYRDDFGGSKRALLDYLAGARPDLADVLRGFDGRIRYDYDWNLNQPDDS